MPNRTRYAAARANLIRQAKRKGWKVSYLNKPQNGDNHDGQMASR